VDATILAQMRQVLRQGGRSDSEIGACIPKVPAIRQRHKQDTEQLLRQNWGAVEALAKELLQHQRVDGPRAHEIIGNAIFNPSGSG
jgi:hypothetical protein